MDNLKKSFHRRELKAPCVAFSSPQGRSYFEEAQKAGTLEAYFPLSEHFTTQAHPAFCGLGSLSMMLNAFLVDPGRLWQGVWRWFDDSMLDCCEPLEKVQKNGINLSKLACLARCNGMKCDL